MINKGLLLALAIGVIAMLLRERAQESSTPPLAVPSAAPSIRTEPGEPTQRAAPVEQAALLAEAITTTANDTAAYEENMKRVLRSQASDEEQLELWGNVQTSKRLDALIAHLKDPAGANPEDVTTRLSLAQTYIVK